MSTARRSLRHLLAHASLTAAVLAHAATAGGQDVGIRASFGGTETSWVAASTPIDIELTRQPASSEGRLAVVIGQTDWSALLERH